ncbi:competence/damage-inducible protein A [Thalassobacillus devorans]|uniref:competence/damage-inducible protein A n=1 Tax=Thalassobacillus devorans TaxID=279813 RepID=UPI00049180B7|nr:competence/damage-inducible protein A [Thalassobacillus devorans]
MKTVNAEIIGIGTELLLGQIANTNAQWISAQLASQGIHVYFHGVVGDNFNRCVETFESAQNRSDLVIVTGGLGPTEDDMTRDAANKLFGQTLLEDAESLKRVEHFYQKNNRIMSPNNRKQALVFEHAKVLQNHEGMAPGMIVEHGGVLWIFLPGVPSEMKYLMEKHVLPYLCDYYDLNTEIVSEMLRFIGIGESQLEHELQHMISSQTNPTIAPLASEGEVGLRLTAKGETKEEAESMIASLKKRILDIVGQYYYGSDETTIQQKVIELLKKEQLTIAAAESLTGGRFTDQMVSVPGASSVCEGSMVTYTPAMKEKLLGVPGDLINTFGTISEECAMSMAVNAQRLTSSDIGISFTGVAGPDAGEGKEPGTVFISIRIKKDQELVRRFHFNGGRETVRNRAVKKGYELLFHKLKKGFSSSAHGR